MVPRISQALSVVISVIFFVQFGAEVQAETLFSNWNAECQYRQRDFRLLAKGLSDALNFFDSHTKDLVLDAALGARILEGQVRIILEGNLNVPSRLRTFLRKTTRKAARISENVGLNVRSDPKISEEQKNSTLPWISSARLWDMPKLRSWKTLKSTGMTEIQSTVVNKSNEAMNEHTSDSCIGHLFQNCQVTPRCQALFLEEPHSMYSLTHQAIFMIITEQLSCNAVPEFRKVFPADETSSQFQAKLCSKILSEANIISNHDFPPGTRDLFAEQVTVCSLLGYEDFLKPEWMYEILFWEKTLTTNSACFTVSDTDTDSKEEQGPAHGTSHRVKRSDALIRVDNGEEDDEQCSAHFTAVSMASLGTDIASDPEIVRYLRTKNQSAAFVLA